MSRIRLSILLVAFALLPAAAHAQNTITACYVPKTGSMYRILATGAPEACKNGHVQFSWDSGGPTGGTVFTKRLSAPVVVVPNSFGQIMVNCEAGETVIGGGFHVEPNGTVSPAANKPLAESETWFVDVRNLSSINLTLYGHAICAKPAG